MKGVSLLTEEQQKVDAEAFKKGVKETGKLLPNHEMKEFTFTRAEQLMLAEQQTILTLAGQTQERIINEVCLKRIGIEPDPKINIQYAIGLGRFVCFVPKIK